jgi:hypothetical protein
MEWRLTILWGRDFCGGICVIDSLKTGFFWRQSKSVFKMIHGLHVWAVALTLFVGSAAEMIAPHIVADGACCTLHPYIGVLVDCKYGLGDEMSE